MTIYEVMRYCRNFFPAYHAYSGTFEIKDGVISLPDTLASGQHFLIEGSSLNDGVYVWPAYGMVDETFSGCITPLNPPPAFLALCERMQEWCEKYQATDSQNMSPFQSESFGGYSYSKAAGSGGVSATVWDTFRAELNLWRKH